MTKYAELIICVNKCYNIRQELSDKAAWRRGPGRRGEGSVGAGLEEARRRSRRQNIVSRLRDGGQGGAVVAGSVRDVSAYRGELRSFSGYSSTLKMDSSVSRFNLKQNRSTNVRSTQRYFLTCNINYISFSPEIKNYSILFI